MNLFRSHSPQWRFDSSKILNIDSLAACNCNPCKWDIPVAPRDLQTIHDSSPQLVVQSGRDRWLSKREWFGQPGGRWWRPWHLKETKKFIVISRIFPWRCSRLKWSFSGLVCIFFASRKGINPRTFFSWFSPEVAPHPQEVFPNQCLHVIGFEDFKVIRAGVLSIFIWWQRQSVNSWGHDVGTSGWHRDVIAELSGNFTVIVVMR